MPEGSDVADIAARGHSYRAHAQAGRAGVAGVESVARAAGAGASDTFPKLLIRNAEMFGRRPAIRHKDLGIWRTWTWAQVRDEVAAFSAGLAELGLKRGDNFAIVGRNRPRLYWAMCAGQALGA